MKNVASIMRTPYTQEEREEVRKEDGRENPLQKEKEKEIDDPDPKQERVKEKERRIKDQLPRREGELKVTKTRVKAKETENLAAHVVKPITRQKIAVKMSNHVRTTIKAIARQ